MIRTPLKVLLVGAVAAGAAFAVRGTPSPTLASAPEGAPAAAPAGSPVGNVAIPLVFEENRGQAGDAVQFLARGKAYTALLEGDRVSFTLPVDAAGAELEKVPGRERRYATVGMRFVGARSDLRLEAGTALEGRVNYLLGNDPADHVVGVPTFSDLRAEEAWPGIDLSWNAAGSAMEYAFEVAPGADAGALAVAFDGALGLAVEEDGDLRIETPGGWLTHGAPVAWQVVDGARVPVEASFAVTGASGASILLGAHDGARAVFVDPTITYSTYLGANTIDYLYGVALDGSGNAYVAGSSVKSATVNYPTTVGAYNTINNGNVDIVLTKLSPTGSLVYSTFIGTVGKPEEAFGVAVDASGQACVAGYTTSAVYPTLNPFQTGLGAANTYAAVVTLLNSTGSALVYSTTLRGNSFDYANGVAIDGSGNLHVVGNTDNASFPVTNGSTFSGGGDDGFYAVLDQAGNEVFGTYIGGTSTDQCTGIVIDASGNANIVGTLQSNYAMTNPYQGARSGDKDVFVARYNSTQALVFSTYIGGSERDEGLAIGVDGNGDAWVTGYTYSDGLPAGQTAYPLVTPFQTATNSGKKVIVSRLHHAAGTTTLTYSSIYGGNGDEMGRGVGVDQDGVVTVAGTTLSSSLLLNTSLQDTLGGVFGVTGDAFLLRFNPGTNENWVLNSTYFGGSTTAPNVDDAALAACVTPTGDALFVGYARSANFPTANAAYATNPGVLSGFASRLSFEEVELDPYWGHLTDAIAAGKDIIKIRSDFRYSIRSPGAFSTADPLLVTITAPGAGAISLDTGGPPTGAWKDKVVSGVTHKIWGGTDASGRTWRVDLDPVNETIEFTVSNFNFSTGIAVSPFKVGVSINWSGNRALHTSAFRNSGPTEFNTLKNNAVLRRP